MERIREVEGWRAIAAAVGRALSRSVSVRTAQRYEKTWLVVGTRGNGVRFVRFDEAVIAALASFRHAPPRKRGRRAPGAQPPLVGDRRRGPRPVMRQLSLPRVA